jgi:predicted O-methyltransferase YrrM
MRTAVNPRQRAIILRNFANTMGPMVELGVDWGLTTAILANRFPNRKLYAVDSWDPKYHSEVMPDGKKFTAEDKYNTVLSLAEVNENVEVIRQDVVECGQQFEGAAGAVFFDAAHEEEPILREFAAWLPHVHDRGVVVVHDANKPGVARACDRAMSGHVFVAGMCVWNRQDGAAIKDI